MTTTPEELDNLAIPPAPSVTENVDDALLKLAHAVDYAAVQLGVIARVAEKIESHLAKMAPPAPGSAATPPRPPIV